MSRSLCRFISDATYCVRGEGWLCSRTYHSWMRTMIVCAVLDIALPSPACRSSALIPHSPIHCRFTWREREREMDVAGRRIKPRAFLLAYRGADTGGVRLPCPAPPTHTGPHRDPHPAFRLNQRRLRPNAGRGVGGGWAGLPQSAASGWRCFSLGDNPMCCVPPAGVVEKCSSRVVLRRKEARRVSCRVGGGVLPGGGRGEGGRGGVTLQYMGVHDPR